MKYLREQDTVKCAHKFENCDVLWHTGADSMSLMFWLSYMTISINNITTYRGSVTMFLSTNTSILNS